jgi:hypothetical protein
MGVWIFQIAIPALNQMLFGWNIYRSLHQIKLSDYIDYVVSGDIKSLKRIKWIFIPKSYEKYVKESLNLEYVHISNNEQLKHNMSITDEINIIVKRIREYQIVKMHLESLTLLEDLGKTVDDSVSMAYIKANRMRVNPFTRERAIIVLESQIKSNYSLYLAKKAQYKTEKKSENVKTTKDDFSKWIAVLNYNNFKASYDMYVADFLHTLNLYKEYSESIKNLTK